MPRRPAEGHGETRLRQGLGEGLDLAVAVPGGTHSGHLSPACTAGVTKWEMFPVAKAQRPRGVLLGEAWAEDTAFPGPFSRVGPAVLVFSMFAEVTRVCEGPCCHDN